MKINGIYAQPQTEELLKKINKEDSIRQRRSLITRYLYQRIKQVEYILTNIDKDDVDLSLVVEQLWEDLILSRNHIINDNTK
jgi:hypothetical protein